MREQIKQDLLNSIDDMMLMIGKAIVAINDDDADKYRLSMASVSSLADEGWNRVMESDK